MYKKTIFKITMMLLTLIAFGGCLEDIKEASKDLAESSGIEKYDILVDENGYSPDKIKIINNNTKKVQLDFKRTTDATCAREVVYEDQGINVELPLNEKVSVVFDVTKDNEVTFGCHMDKMFKGVIVKSKSI